MMQLVQNEIKYRYIFILVCMSPQVLLGAPPGMPNITLWKAYFECVDLFLNHLPWRKDPMKPEMALTCRK